MTETNTPLTPTWLFAHSTYGAVKASEINERETQAAVRRLLGDQRVAVEIGGAAPFGTNVK